MKKLILSELLLLFLATTFVTDSPPPGWYQQTLPVSDQINDIFFLDSLTGWVVTNGNYNANDTSYIMHTIDGGNNWVIQEKNRETLNVVQFLDANTGYAAGGVNGTVWCTILKTTNSGTNWVQINNIGVPSITDMQFINKDTGWVCWNSVFDGGLWKTTDGGGNWLMELDQTYRPYRMSFINKDTGWVTGSSVNYPLLRTTNGGGNWNVQYGFTGSSVLSIYFLNGLSGYIGGGGSGNIQYTTNGGFNWLISQGEVGGYDIKFANDSVGWAGGGSQPLRIIKTTNGGRTWGYQTAPATPDISIAILKNDTLSVWAGRQVLIHTTDGGGPVLDIKQIQNSIPENFKLYQNYPNPFNPSTVIKFQIKKTAHVGLKVFDISGKEVAVLLDEKQSAPSGAGTYEVSFTAGNLSSGVYFYSLYTDGNLIETKRMILLK